MLQPSMASWEVYLDSDIEDNDLKNIGYYACRKWCYSELPLFKDVITMIKNTRYLCAHFIKRMNKNR